MKRRARKTAGIPVLKLPPNRLEPVLTALERHEYDRLGFREAVMEQFSADKDEKSVFRGMAIPTLRALGLLAGFEATIHLSADGALAAAAVPNPAVLSALLQEIEAVLGIDQIWESAIDRDAAVSRLCSVEATATDETRRRVQRWIAYLEYFGVLREHGRQLIRLPRSGAVQFDIRDFERRLLAAYVALSPRTIGEPSVEIDAIARVLILRCYHENGTIFTRKSFDRHLALISRSDDTPIRLHRSMGAAQGLFFLDGEAYESLSIQRRPNV